MSQQTQVLYHLINIGPLTPLEGLKKYGTMRLGAIIFDLRKAGHNIKTTTIKNGRKHYASYSIEKRAEGKSPETTQKAEERTVEMVQPVRALERQGELFHM